MGIIKMVFRNGIRLGKPYRIRRNERTVRFTFSKFQQKMQQKVVLISALHALYEELRGRSDMFTYRTALANVVHKHFVIDSLIHFKL